MAYCCDLWRLARPVCMQAGRDLVRLFFDCGLSKKAGLAPIWNDITGTATGAGAGAGATTPPPGGKSVLLELMQTRTPNKVLHTRV